MGPPFSKNGSTFRRIKRGVAQVYSCARSDPLYRWHGTERTERMDLSAARRSTHQVLARAGATR